MEGDTPAKNKCTPSPIGAVHLDSAEVRTAGGTLHLCVAIDRTGQCADAERHEGAHTMVAAQCLRHLVAAVPSKSPTGLTEHGIQFTNRTRAHSAFAHIVDRVGQEYGMRHRLTNTNPPWTTGQVGRMHRTRKEATVKRDD
jgi:hypothetical protein